MQMRVTLQSRMIPLKHAIEQRTAESQKSLREVATGRRLLTPSDDPTGTRHSLINRARLTQIDQFISNIDQVHADLNMSDALLDQTADRIRRAQEIAISLSSGIQTDGRRAATLEVDGLIDEIIAIANTSIRGRHLFGGESTVETPFVRDGDEITYNGSDSGALRRVSSDDPLVATTMSGAGVFFETRDAETNVVQDGIFSVLTDLRDALQNDDGEAIAATLDGLEVELDRSLEARTSVGARSVRVVQVRERHETARLEIESLQSLIEDADLTRAITELQARQIALQATLAATAQILPTTLMDFLF